jgi:arylsulfatase A
MNRILPVNTTRMKISPHRRKWRAAFGAALLALTPLITGAAPNVVFILIDDLSHYGVTAYGANRLSSSGGEFTNVTFSTPHMDRLATEGLRCTRAYAYPLCEPTRTTLMSGKYNSRNHLVSKGQHASDITFGDVFKRAGYATGMTGKWKQTRGTKEIPGQRYISEFGWDEYCCFDVVNAGRRYLNPNLVINGKVVNYTDKMGRDPATGRRWYGPDVCERFALEFIERHQHERFFLYYPMVLVHDEHKPTPDTVPRSAFDEFDDAIDNRNGRRGDDRKYFPDMIAYADKMVGNIVAKLEALGLRQNTLIVLMADNGTKEAFTHILPDGSTYPGGKGSTTDAGTHVPLILSQPGTIPAAASGHGRVYDGIVDLADLYPTLCEASGIVPPNRADLDGISFWPQVLGKTTTEHRASSYVWYNGNTPATDLSELLEYAFDKNFKRYAPHQGFSKGRFFDLRTDLLEVGGRTKLRAPGWNKWYSSGLALDQLTAEQKAAYDRLGQVLEARRYVPVKALQIGPRALSLAPGKTATLAAAVTPAHATRNNVIWESSAPALASVDKFGRVTAHRAGEARIAVNSWDDARPLANNAAETFSRGGISDAVTVRVR